MKPSLLSILRCPESGTPLTLHIFETEKILYESKNEEKNDKEIIEGILTSETGLNYPIIGGIPRLLPKALLHETLLKYYPDFLDKYNEYFEIDTDSRSNLKSVNTLHMFSYQWTTFVDNYDYFKDLFLSFVNPFLCQDDFNNKKY